MNYIKNTIWNSIGITIYLACQWLITLLVVWIYDDFTNAGNLALAMNITNFFACIAVYNIRTFQVSDVKYEFTDKEYIINRVLLCGISFILCFIFLLFNNFSLMQKLIILCFMAFRCIEAFIDVLHGINQKNWKMEYIGVSFILRGISMLVIFILIGNFYGLLPAVIGMGITSFLVCLIYDLPNTKKIASLINFSIGKVFLLTKKCFPLMLVILISTLMASFSRYSIEIIHGTEALGVYAAIIAPAMIIQISASFIFAPLINVFASCLKESRIQKFQKLFIYTSLFVIALTLLAYIIAIFLGEWALTLIFGDAIVPYAYLLNGAIVISGLTAFMWFMNIIFVTMRDIKGILIGNIIGAIICLLLTNYFLVSFNLMGANYIIILSLGAALTFLFLRLYMNLKKLMQKQ